MTILFRTQGVYLQDGRIGDTRYFNSASALAKSIETGYIRPSISGKSYDLRYEVKVFSDIPGEIENFKHEAFYELMDKYEKGFTFSEDSPASRTAWDPKPLTAEEQKALKSWQRRLAKASKDYRDKLSQAIEACYP